LKQFDEEQTQKLGKENIVLQDVNDKFEPILSKKWSKFAEFLSQGEKYFVIQYESLYNSKRIFTLLSADPKQICI